MKIIHTSDWHLGRLLRDERRDDALSEFLDWLLKTMAEQQCDALLVSGDIFDTTVPSSAAQKLYYSFLARVKSETCCRSVIITGGNHDSPMLLAAPKELLAALNIHVTGRAARNPGDEVVLVKDTDGNAIGIVLAVPFLREGDLHTLSDEETQADRRTRLIEAVRKHYEDVTNAATALYPEYSARLPLIAMGHLFAAGGATGTTERNLYVGSLGDVPDAIFPAAIDYLALGHLHRPQIVAKNPAHRYCGSPVALDFSEAKTDHLVLLVEFTGKTPVVTEIPVPQSDRLIHLEGTADEILAAAKTALTDTRPGLIEAVHTGKLPAPGLESELQALLKGSSIKLIRVADRAITRPTLARKNNVQSVEELTPEKVFELRLDKSNVSTDDPARTKLVLAYSEILHELATAEKE